MVTESQYLGRCKLVQLNAISLPLQLDLGQQSPQVAPRLLHPIIYLYLLIYPSFYLDGASEDN